VHARELLLVPHTHWDREWYRTHEEFRFRLVGLVDRLLDLLEHDPGYTHFTLDGQTIVLDDYLAVRPGARARIEKQVRAGRLRIGPWHVLPDEWLVSGEALIRNLRLGLRRAEAFGGAMPLGYVPDQFGHVGQLPQLFARFGFADAALWRGVGGDVTECGFWWEAPDGSRVFTLYLPFGYSHGASLPLEPGALAARLGELGAALDPYAERTATRVILNGSDHLEPQAGLPRALEGAAQALPELALRLTALPEAVARVREALAEGAAVHRGELRSGLRAPLLPGCASARAPQKQRDFANDALLVKEVEPLAAWSGWLGGPVDRELLAFTWGIVLENHPHDSICGCSIDAVHRQMEPRFDRVAELGRLQRAQHCAELARRIGRPSPDARAGEPLAVWNPNAGGPAWVERTLELDLPGLAPERLRRGARVPLHLRTDAGERIGVRADVVAPGFRWRSSFSKELAVRMLPGLDRELFYFHVNGVAWDREDGRLTVRAQLGSEPRGPLDVAGTKRALLAALEDPATTSLEIDAQAAPRLRLGFADTLPGHGLRLYRVAPGRAGGTRTPRSGRLADGGAWAEGGRFRLEVDGEGRVRIEDRERGHRIEDALRLVSEADRGDSYNFDPLPEAPLADRLEAVRVRPERASEAEATLVLQGRLRVPAALAPSRRERAARKVALPVRLRLRVHAALDRVDLEVEVENRAEDHRLRLHLRAPFAPERLAVESAFEVVERPLLPARDAFGTGTPAEWPVGAGPQRSFATLCGDGLALTLANRGSAEVEGLRAPDGRGELAVTLLRAVGWLSRADLGLRPGPAGPLLPTPEAQVPGPHRAAFSFRIHAADAPDRTSGAHAFATPPLAFAPGERDPGAPRPLLADGARLVEIDDPEVVVSALEPLPDGALGVRLHDCAGRARTLRGRIAGARSIRAVDLRGAPEPRVALETGGERFALGLGAWQIVDLEARRDG